MIVLQPQASVTDVARQLDAVGERLAQQHADPFRAQAYHRAADTIRNHRGSLVELIEREGQCGLEQLPHMGPATASAILELVHTGRLRMLDRLISEWNRPGEEADESAETVLEGEMPPWFYVIPASWP